MLKNSFLTLKFELEAKAHLGGTGLGKPSAALAAEFCVVRAVPGRAGRTFCQQRFGEKTLKFILRVFTHDPDSLVIKYFPRERGEIFYEHRHIAFYIKRVHKRNIPRDINHFMIPSYIKDI